MGAVPDSDSASRSEPMGPFDQVMSDAMDRAEAANDGSSSSSSSASSAASPFSAASSSPRPPPCRRHRSLPAPAPHSSAPAPTSSCRRPPAATAAPAPAAAPAPRPSFRQPRTSANTTRCFTTSSLWQFRGERRRRGVASISTRRRAGTTYRTARCHACCHCHAWS